MTAAPENGALRKNRMSMRGSGLRSSQTISAARAAAARMKPTALTAGPAARPSMIPYVSVPSRTMTSSCPIGSSLRADGAFDSGTKRQVRNRASRPIGTLIQKMARQFTVSVSRPPTTGPSAMLTPTTPPHTPIAWARSLRSVNVFVMIDMATGLSIDPPTAWTIRAATSQPRLGARLHSNDPAVKTTRPVWNVRRRPIRSAVEPTSISRLASVSV